MQCIVGVSLVDNQVGTNNGPSDPKQITTKKHQVYYTKWAYTIFFTPINHSAYIINCGAMYHNYVTVKLF